jgi:arylsulfatase A-like enzyme
LKTAGIRRDHASSALLACGLLLLAGQLFPARAQEAGGPNILFIAVDDLNDWIGCMGGHPLSVTPNLDRLAASGALFTNAHCAGNACNASRTAVMTGIAPNVSGLYDNRQPMRAVLPDAKIMPQYFRDHGYTAWGAGKILHYFIDAPSWDAYFPAAETENPLPRTLYPEKRPVSLPVGGPWQYQETDWAALDASDEEFGGDHLVSGHVAEKLAVKHDKPFFLACGIYRPHEPWFVPKKYFEKFPLEDIKPPPGYREDDNEDLPPAGRKLAETAYFPHIRKHGQWERAMQAYLASIHFADAMLGRVLDALEAGPNADNTIVVLWSDHGWHLGEKQHWQKFTPWRACTRVPLMMRVPAGISTLKPGTTAGTVCDQPVSLLSLFPTLLELSGLPEKKDNDGPSLVPLLTDASADWPHVAVTFQHQVGSFGLSAKDWRYIRHRDGGEELYHIKADPHEWTNLAAVPEHAPKLEEMRALAPKTFAPMPAAKGGD